METLCLLSYRGQHCGTHRAPTDKVTQVRGLRANRIPCTNRSRPDPDAVGPVPSVMMAAMTRLSSLPRPRTPDPLAAPVLRWGILGTGWIADKFTRALLASTTQRVQAVGSRSGAGAQAFADRFGIAKAHRSYEDLVADPEVDVVYIATPHNFHHPHALLALRAGKAVLIEKPLALNADQAREVFAEAADRGLFCMEALWTYFLPKFDVVGQLLADGVLGEVRTVIADHAQAFEAEHRIMRPELAGGPMMDMMTYPASLAQWVLGPPATLAASSTWLPSGVTGQTSIMYATAANQQALLHSSVLGPTPSRAYICGTEAMLTFDENFYRPGGFVLSDQQNWSLHFDEAAIDHGGLFWQAAEVARRMAAGETGSPLRPAAATIAMLEIMDAARQQTGERLVGE